ncbi:MAG: hypothetical protein LBB84_07370 [Tannerellaceae bacterium]|nr:hypothetical protein [Tannerellaceae bacterium]
MKQSRVRVTGLLHFVRKDDFGFSPYFPKAPLVAWGNILGYSSLIPLLIHS